MSEQIDYKAWFEKYRPRIFEDIIFPNEDIKNTLKGFYDNGFIKGNILSYGPPGTGKTTLSEVLIHRIVKSPHDLFILGRKVDDIDNLKRWLQQRPVASKQKIVKIEEMDQLSYKAQIVLKDGLMEKYQHNTTFLATTNKAEKIDPALITRCNTKINFQESNSELIQPRLEFILNSENIKFDKEALTKFTNDYYKRGLRDLINNLELASISGEFNVSILDSFIGGSGNEDLIVSYIIYLVGYVEALSVENIQKIIKDPKSDQTFFTYYSYMLSVFKNELRLSYHDIYKQLVDIDSKLDFSAKNIVNDYWQDLDLKRFKHTHTVALLHELILNVLEQKGSG